MLPYFRVKSEFKMSTDVDVIVLLFILIVVSSKLQVGNSL